MKEYQHRIVLWSVTGVVAILLAVAALWLVAYAIQQNYNSIKEAKRADCTSLQVENRAIISLLPKNSPYLSQVSTALHDAERKVCR